MVFKFCIQAKSNINSSYDNSTNSVVIDDIIGLVKVATIPDYLMVTIENKNNLIWLLLIVNLI